MRATGDIGCFKITEVTALSAGQRRIVATTGPKAVELFQESFSTVKTLAQEFKTQLNQVTQAVEKQREQYKLAQTELRKLKKQLMHAQLPELLQQIRASGQIPYGIFFLEQLESAELKEVAQTIQQKKPGLYILVSDSPQGIALYAELASVFEKAINFGSLKEYFTQKGLRSGGKGLSLQGGGALTISKHQFIQELTQWLKNQQK